MLRTQSNKISGNIHNLSQDVARSVNENSNETYGIVLDNGKNIDYKILTDVGCISSDVSSRVHTLSDEIADYVDKISSNL
jgi:hypothetical protein